MYPIAENVYKANNINIQEKQIKIQDENLSEMLYNECKVNFREVFYV